MYLHYLLVNCNYASHKQLRQIKLATQNDGEEATSTKITVQHRINKIYPGNTFSDKEREMILLNIERKNSVKCIASRKQAHKKAHLSDDIHPCAMNNFA